MDLALSSYTFSPGAALELDLILPQEEDLQWRDKEPVKDDKRAFYSYKETVNHNPTPS